jgi:spore germination cell wall hydrolase CwlJ-like protein
MTDTMTGGPILFIDAEPDAESQLAPTVRGSAVDVLARTLWGEARGEPVRGIEAVAAVVANRVRKGGWWGRDVISVCRKPSQFSCWNPADPNRAKLERVDESDRVFRICVRIARRAIAGSVVDPTAGATHYHVRGCVPAWAHGREPSAEIGNHLFYNDVA